MAALTSIPTANGSSLGRQCRIQCGDEIAACVAAGGRRARCRREVLPSLTSTADTGLTGSTTYSYAVSAVDNAGNESAWTTTQTATTTVCVDTVPPCAPSGLSATASSSSSIDLSWLDTNSREYGYTVERSLSGAEGARRGGCLVWGGGGHARDCTE